MKHAARHMKYLQIEVIAVKTHKDRNFSACSGRYKREKFVVSYAISWTDAAVLFWILQH
jgi:hypothetical protein